MQLAPNTAGDLAGVISQYTDLTKDEDGKDLPQDRRLDKGMAQMGRVAYGLNEGRGTSSPWPARSSTPPGPSSRWAAPVEDLGRTRRDPGRRVHPRQPPRVRAPGSARPSGGSGTPSGIGRGLPHQDGQHRRTPTPTSQRLEKVKAAIDSAKKNGMPAGRLSPGRRVHRPGRDAGPSASRSRTSTSSNSGSRRGGPHRPDRSRARTTNSSRSRTEARRRQLARKAGQEFLVGESTEPLAIAKENAEQKLREKGEIGGVWNGLNFLGSDVFNGRWLGNEPAEERYKYFEAEKDLRLRAERIGIDKEKAQEILWIQATARLRPAPGQDGIQDLRPGDQKGRTEGFNRLFAEVEKRGVSYYGEAPRTDEKLDELIREARETNKILANGGAHQRGVVHDSMGREHWFEKTGPDGRPVMDPLKGAAQPGRP